QASGLSWLAALSIAALLSLAVTGLAAWRVSVFFDHAGMHATRRQLAKLGLFSEDDEEDAAEASAEDGPAP
ncbi:MAG TPA: phage holin family protein, partial [Luteimonas sp.]|nr:phage holin family protein [Luteimonas sp.]